MADLERLVTSLNELYRISGSAKVHADTVRSTGVQVTQTGLRFLSLVEDSPGISASDLAQALDVSQPTASRTLQQLEGEGLITRSTSTQDGRVSHLATTSKGKRSLAKVARYHSDRLVFALEGLPAKECDLLVRSVTDLVGRLQAAARLAERRTA